MKSDHWFVSGAAGADDPHLAVRQTPQHRTGTSMKRSAHPEVLRQTLICSAKQKARLLYKLVFNGDLRRAYGSGHTSRASSPQPQFLQLVEVMLQRTSSKTSHFVLRDDTTFTTFCSCVPSSSGRHRKRSDSRTSLHLAVLSSKVNPLRRQRRNVDVRLCAVQMSALTFDLSVWQHSGGGRGGCRGDREGAGVLRSQPESQQPGVARHAGRHLLWYRDPTSVSLDRRT